jgi:hypothetical protein
MTIEPGNPEVSGFGNTGQGDAGQAGGTHGAEPSQGAQGPSGANGGGAVDAMPDDHADVGEVALDFNYEEAVPGFEASASDCLNRALAIAQSLNHVVLSSDHLMLALTLDASARRLLDRVGDVTQLREAAMRRLGKMHSQFSIGDPSQTADLADIRKIAREAAAEREQLVAISDLVNAFPREE